MDKSAADDDWHRCGTYDTDNMSNAEALIAKGSKYLQQGDTAAPDDSQTAPLDPHASDWYDEKHRVKSPLLQTYENAIEPIAQKTGLADVLATCGIRGTEWQQRAHAILDSRLHSPTNQEMAQRLSAADAKAAARFMQTVIAGTMKVTLGGQSKEAACRSIADMPFAANDDAFAF